MICLAIPTAKHRYPTIGDYWIDPAGILQFRISEELSPKAQQLCLIHEMAEAFMCLSDGVTFESIDKFDKAFEASRAAETDEPGDDPAAPYRRQHRRAENLERLLADYLEVHWGDYEAEFEAVCKTLDRLVAAGHWPEIT